MLNYPKLRRFMSTIDTAKLRAYLEDYYGTATFNGFPAAMTDLIEISSLNDYELCKYAEENGVDLTDFSIDQKGKSW